MSSKDGSPETYGNSTLTSVELTVFSAHIHESFGSPYQIREMTMDDSIHKGVKDVPRSWPTTKSFERSAIEHSARLCDILRSRLNDFP